VVIEGDQISVKMNAIALATSAVGAATVMTSIY